MRGSVAILLVVPVVVFLVAVYVQREYEATWQAVLAREYPSVSAAQRQQLTLKSLCADPELAGETMCSDLAKVRLLRQGAVVGAVLGIALLLGIRWAGQAGVEDRTVLLRLFRPGLHVTLWTLVGLIGLQAVLAIGALYYGMATATGYVLPKLMAGIGLGALIGMGMLIKASLSVVGPLRHPVVGKPLGKEEHAALCDLVRDVAAKVGTQPPNTILAGLEPNFFVTEAEIVTPSSRYAGRTLYLSLPLCRVLERAELRAIIAHELAHFHGQDTQFSVKFYPIYRGATQALHSLASAAAERTTQLLATLPALMILRYFLDSFETAEAKLSRERELAADRVAATVGGVMPTATALLRVHLYDPAWPVTLGLARKAVSERQAYANLSETYQRVVEATPLPTLLAQVDARTHPHPTDSHPPLSARLEALGQSVNDLIAHTQNPVPADPAINLVTNYEQLEHELSRMVQSMLAQPDNGVSSSPVQ